MRFQVQEHTRNAAPFETSFQRGNRRGKVAQNDFVAAVTQIGRNKVPQRIFIDMPDALGRLRMAVIFDVHPTQAGLHRQVLLEDLIRRVTLNDHIGCVEDQH